MGTFETPVTMQAGHKYFSNPVSARSESDNASRLIPRVGEQPASNDRGITLIKRRVQYYP